MLRLAIAAGFARRLTMSTLGVARIKPRVRVSTDPAPPSEKVSVQAITSAGFGGGLSRFREFREAMGDTCDLMLPGTLDAFQAQSRALNLSNAVLSEMRSCSLNYYRTASHIARSGYSHYQINLNLAGQSIFHSGRLSTVLRPGDVGILDTSRPADTFVQAPSEGSACSLALFIPRGMLMPLLPHSDAAHCALISGTTQAGRLLHEEIVSLFALARSASVVMLETTVQRIAQLVASGLAARPAAGSAVLASIKRHLDSNLDARDGLSIDAICRRFACSRATLYRLFEADGGPVNYVRERRLQHAFIELISPGHRRRIIDIAMHSQFASEATFNRAFRRMFGIPPGAARELAQPSTVHLNGHAAPDENDRSTLTVRWIKRLERM